MSSHLGSSLDPVVWAQDRRLSRAGLAKLEQRACLPIPQPWAPPAKPLPRVCLTKRLPWACPAKLLLRACPRKLLPWTCLTKPPRGACPARWSQEEIPAEPFHKVLLKSPSQRLFPWIRLHLRFPPEH